MGEARGQPFCLSMLQLLESTPNALLDNPTLLTCRPGGKAFNLMHIGGQSVCLSGGINGSPAGPDTPLAVDVILAQETLDEDMQLLISEINRRRDPGLPPFPDIKLKQNGVRDRGHLKKLYEFAADMPHTLEAAFSGPNAVCLSQMAKHYHRDFELLGFAWPSALNGS